MGPLLASRGPSFSRAPSLELTPWKIKYSFPSVALEDESLHGSLATASGGSHKLLWACFSLRFSLSSLTGRLPGASEYLSQGPRVRPVHLVACPSKHGKGRSRHHAVESEGVPSRIHKPIGIGYHYRYGGAGRMSWYVLDGAEGKAAIAPLPATCSARIWREIQRWRIWALAQMRRNEDRRAEGKEKCREAMFTHLPARGSSETQAEAYFRTSMTSLALAVAPAASVAHSA